MAVGSKPMASHKYFEELSALAAVGELNGEELVALNEHLSQCEPCRAASSEFSRIVHAELPAVHDESVPWLRKVVQAFQTNGYTERFLRRAKAEGVSLSQPVKNQRAIAGVLGASPRSALVAASLLVVLAVGLVAALEFKKRQTQSAGVADIQQELHEALQRERSLKTDLTDSAQIIADLRGKLAASKAAFAPLFAHSAAADKERARIAAEAQLSKEALDAELAKSAEMTHRLQEQERRLAAVNNEIARLGGIHAADAVQIATQREQVNDLSQQLKAQADVLNSERQLLSAGRDIRELMGARNLHIIDVFDTDPKGNNRRAFGRVFLTEGKSLIFYAFDLTAGNAINAKQSFQAWGLRDGETTSAKSLGIFYVDDAAQRRWVLKVQDPNLLSQIDSVFVTAEPSGGASQPSGHRLLYAYLKQQANHP